MTSAPRVREGRRGGADDPRVVRSRAAALAATREILDEEGWDGVTHVAVSARSGVGRTTLYRHWPDAAALIRDALREQLELNHTAPTGVLRDDLLAELDAVRGYLHRPATERLMRMVMGRASLSPACADLQRALHLEGTRICTEIIETARAHGDLPASLDPQHAVEKLLGPLFFRRLFANRDLDAAYVTEVVDEFLSGSGARADHVRGSARPGFRNKPTLKGKRLWLRPVTVGDLPALLPMFRDAEIARLTGSHGDHEPDEARLRTWYDTRQEQDDRLDLAVVEAASGNVVGEVVLNEWDPYNKSCNFRISLVPGAHGRGLGTEATRLIVGHGFEELALHRISLEVYAFNPSARRVYEKAGFVAEGVLRDALLRDGERVDATVMSILAPEWFRRRAGSRPVPSGIKGA